MADETIINENSNTTTAKDTENAHLEARETQESSTPNQEDVSFSLLLDYDAAGVGTLRVTSDKLFEQAQEESPSTEEAKKLKEELHGAPQAIEKDPSVVTHLHAAFSEIVTLYTEVEQKRHELIEVNTSLKNKLQTLKDINKITINQSVFESNEDSINRYIQLIEELIKEVRSEVELLAMILQCKKVYLSFPDETARPGNAFAVVESKIKNIKRYMKNVRRDINVSYSRYSFGLNAQMKQIAYFELATKRDNK